MGDAEIQEIKEELLSLASIEQFTEYDMPDEQQLEILDQYLNAVEAVDAQVRATWGACRLRAKGPAVGRR